MAGENFTAAELAVLRGTLEPSSNTARDLAITAQTRCTRRRALAVIGIKNAIGFLLEENRVQHVSSDVTHQRSPGALPG